MPLSPNFGLGPRRQGFVKSVTLKPEIASFRQGLRDAELQRQRLGNQLLSNLVNGGGIGGVGQPGFADDPANDLFDQIGQSGRDRIERDFNESNQAALANLSDRGLGNSTAQATITQGSQQRRQEALNHLNDQLLGRRINFIQGERARQSQQSLGLIGQLLGNL